MTDPSTTRMPGSYHSARGIPLVQSVEHVVVPTLTVEYYLKWYSLHLIRPGEDPAVSQVFFHHLEDYFSGTCFRDHVPNPDAVRAFTDAHGYVFDGLAEELIMGRWVLESS